MQTVLIAEDNRDLAETMQLALEPLDVEVCVAYDGPSAIEIARERMPQLAVLDIGLPGADGYRVCRALRALPGGAELRIVALTTWGTIQDRERGAAAGFDEHWAKPIGIELLLDLVRRHLHAAA
jgi:CheY-like chemotaxis protein